MTPLITVIGSKSVWGITYYGDGVDGARTITVIGPAFPIQWSNSRDSGGSLDRRHPA
jgi:hypothetical protein